MLNLKERHWVLVFLRYCSICCQLPITVDPTSWEVRAATGSKWIGWVSTGLYASFVVHALSKLWSLLNSLFFSTGIPLHQIMIHFDVVSTAVMTVSWYYVLYIKHTNVTTGFAKITLTGGKVAVSS